jgi:hypothetical protein
MTRTGTRILPVLSRRINLLALLLVIGAFNFLAGCVGLTGGTSGGGLTALPGSVSFGNVNTGSSSARSVTVTNGGDLPLTVGNVAVSGPGFSVSGVPVGLALDPGETAALSVTFSPSSAGAATGKVTVSDQSAEPLLINLAGTGVASGHSVTLSWNASPSGVTGYRAYRATNPAGPYTALNPSPTPQLRYTDSTVQAGTTYYYVVAAVASGSVESAYSNQASAAVPKP